ncbi:hypothetical protein AB4259_00630 [Vibrio amylolyticus]|uniref:hypothetical protein n=1 Tax=Vibrio amylolyticus TaxID=2847292 RepID=UPI0035506FAA
MQNVGQEIGEVILFVLLPLIAVGLSRLIRVKVIRQIHNFGSIVFIGSALHAVLMLESGVSRNVAKFLFLSVDLIYRVTSHHKKDR